LTLYRSQESEEHKSARYTSNLLTVIKGTRYTASDARKLITAIMEAVIPEEEEVKNGSGTPEEVLPA
jgi:hypothetical protein